METVIKMRLSELNNSAIEKLKTIVRQLSAQDDPEFAILVNTNSNKIYFEQLQSSIDQLETGEILSFTMEEFDTYVKTNLSEMRTVQFSQLAIEEMNLLNQEMQNWYLKFLN